MLRTLAPLRRQIIRASCSSKRHVSFYNSSLAGLTDDQAELREAVSSWAQKEVAPRAHEIDKENKSPMDLWPKLGEMGLLGITVPEEDGGLGRGYLEHTIVMEGEFYLFGGKYIFMALYLLIDSFPSRRIVSCLGFPRLIIWCTFESVCQSDQKEWNSKTKGQVSS